ncbi:hypothetical protein KSP39_PZI004494 [Platanthera zijinensis]|uniref:Uncharacterized protein n=1 Tax=Platanthera zijinensis TaxID=2320716 RepID=A0AAP0BUB0_9ASPA
MKEEIKRWKIKLDLERDGMELAKMRSGSCAALINLVKGCPMPCPILRKSSLSEVVSLLMFGACPYCEHMLVSVVLTHRSERSHYSSSDGDEMNSKKSRYSRHLIRKERSSKRSRHHVSSDENEQLAENRKSEEHVYSRSFYFRTDEAVEGTSKKHRSTNLPRNHSRHERRRSKDRSSSRRKRKACSEEQDNSERNGTSKSHKKNDKKYESIDHRLDFLDHWDSFSRHSSGSPNRYEGKCSHEDSDSEEDSAGARYCYSSHSGKRRK